LLRARRYIAPGQHARDLVGMLRVQLAPIVVFVKAPQAVVSEAPYHNKRYIVTIVTCQPPYDPTVTRTFEFETASGVYTELQCGSYIFMAPITTAISTATAP
jgi:hypothetical protein